MGLQRGGPTHSLALTSGGAVLAWGNSTWGKTFVPAAAMSDIVAISAGRSSSFALTSSGAVIGWGVWSDFDWSDFEPVPTTIINGGIAAMSAGFYGLTGLTSGGKVLIFGPACAAPGCAMLLTADFNIVAVAASETHALALTSDGKVVQWGENLPPAPAAVQQNIDAISAGAYWSAALPKH